MSTPIPPTPGKTPKEAPLTDEELERALEYLFYSAHQCATWHFWFLLMGPILKTVEDPAIRTSGHLVQNGVVEAALLFIRKTAEFFKPQEATDRADTIYSYRYSGYTRQEWIIPRDPTYIELHKRVGHITIRQVRFGRVEWPMFPMAMQAMTKWAEFFEALAALPVAHNAKRTEQCGQYARAIQTLIRRMEDDVKKDAALGKEEAF